MIKIKSFASVAIFAFATTVLTVFSGCSKDEGLVPGAQMDEKEMLVFKDYEEYAQTLQKAISLNPDELKVWEEAQGFKSFGRKCEEIYYSIDPDQFNSLEEIKEYVAKHSEYLVLIKDENDEYTVESSLYNNPSRYIVNEKRMYQLGESVFKVFEKHSAYTNVGNIDKLIHLNESDLLTKKFDSKITIVKNIATMESKDVGNNCGAGEFEKNRYSTSGKQRIKLYITAHQPPAGAPGFSYARAYFLVKPYERTLYAWFGTSKRTVTADIKLALDFMTPNGWDRKEFMEYYSPRKVRKIDGEIGEFVNFNYSDYPIYVHFGSYDCWATSGPVCDEDGNLRYAKLKCGDLF